MTMPDHEDIETDAGRDPKRMSADERRAELACIVNFHGRPKPCDFTTGWVADTWKQESPVERSSHRGLPGVG